MRIIPGCLLTRSKRFLSTFSSLRPLKISPKSLYSTTSDRSESWLSSMLRRDNSQESQSDLLSSADAIFELQVHDVKPQHMFNYLKEFEYFLEVLSKTDSKSELLGSWICEIGQQDAACMFGTFKRSVSDHLWKYDGGYPCLSAHNEIYREHKELTEYRQNRNMMLRCRRNQICLAFSFWPDPTPRPNESNLYELRSYALKPGTMLEWGNHWARGLRLRSKRREPVAGLFSHIGELHMVNHLWAYNSLEARKKSREDVWQEPGWNKCVMSTVPLIRHMTSSILRPTSFSRMQ
ncbi:hypothetical protein PHET_05145 [Paragonimus heterotremus]|uniref:NIPSNAP domain-containing protein n=1 Tax=Paragonimus heterotremus TaxID=100268 RepID=A0A8J4TGM3_9TREM|nr:hypothetical protein PHET_05145 [Paragonimus heterotremus]